MKTVKSHVDNDSTYFVVYRGEEPSGTLFAKANEEGVWSQGGKTFFIRNGRYSTDSGWVGYVEAIPTVSSSQASIGMFEHTQNGGSDLHRIFQNGIEAGSTTWNFDAHSELNLQDGGIFKIGYTSTNFPQDHGLYGKIAEIIKVDQLLTDHQRTCVHAYLASKWGITGEVDSDGDGTSDDVDESPIDPDS